MLINENNYVPSNSNTDESSVASHSCTDGNSIEQAKITSENCLQRTKETMFNDCIDGQAASWITVYDFLCENGLEEFRIKQRTWKSGIEIVIMFLELLLNEEQEVKECDATMPNSSNVADNQKEA